MSIGQTQEPTRSPQHPFVFALANLAASQDATDVPILGGVNNTYVMPKGGCIVGYGIQLSAAVAAGSLDVDLEIDGASTLTIAADTASTTEFYSTIEFGNEPFSAGAKLGVTYTSDGSLSPTTADMNVVVYVMFREWDV